MLQHLNQIVQSRDPLPRMLMRLQLRIALACKQDCR